MLGACGGSDDGEDIQTIENRLSSFSITLADEEYQRVTTEVAVADITWQESSTAVSYELFVYKGADTSAPVQYRFTTSDSYVSSVEFDIDQQYTLEVVAKDQYGQTRNSGVVVFTTPTPYAYPPTIPAIYVDDQDGTLELNWISIDPDGDIIRYEAIVYDRETGDEIDSYSGLSDSVNVDVAGYSNLTITVQSFDDTGNASLRRMYYELDN